MLYEQFIKQYVGYAAYHQDERNEITHFFGVPPIMISILFVLMTEELRFDDLSVFGLPVGVSLIVFLVATLTWIALDFVLGALVFLLFLPFMYLSVGWTDALSLPMTILVFVLVQVASWAIQLVGHVFEGRRPRILENFFQSTLAMMFLVQIVLNMLGLRKKMQARVDQEIDAWNRERGLVKGKAVAAIDAAQA